jgi:hypothetical protein
MPKVIIKHAASGVPSFKLVGNIVGNIQPPKLYVYTYKSNFRFTIRINHDKYNLDDTYTPAECRIGTPSNR